MAQPEGLRFSKSHEWVRVEGDTATVGITQHAADELGDIALVLPPEVGRVLKAGEPFGEIESLKAVSDLYAPVGGTVAAVNDALPDAPERVNDDPYGDGWIIKIRMSDPAELSALLDAAAYDALIGEA
ncbi:MAG: glycine cleavage system protein GcvH [Armatimonadetes bacterium]|nr:glycine cleavage system protein GcvH [Armatimonadota bacterium]